MKYVVSYRLPFERRTVYFAWMEMVDMGTTRYKKDAFVFDSKREAQRIAKMTNKDHQASFGESKVVPLA